MAYSHTTYKTLRQQVALRLYDTSNIFWTDAEIGIYVKEAMQTFGLCSGFWRQRASVQAAANVAFYDITTQTFGSPSLQSLLGYTITDRAVIQTLQFHLLESTASQSSWSGTEMFTLDDLRFALQRRRDQFLADTGVTVTRSLVSASNYIVALTDTVMDIRRAAWVGLPPVAYHNPAWRDDERLMTAGDPLWSVNTGTPQAFSVMAGAPLSLRLAPAPIAAGQLELLTVNSGAALNPASSATVLGIPDDLVPGIKWGALADLLGKDGIAADPARAQYCEQRYQLYVQLARALPAIIHAEVEGAPVIPLTLQELEAYNPSWEDITGPPVELAIAGPNMVALSPVPTSTAYSATLDVVQKAPLPSADIDQIQLGREQLDMIVDYAEHLALFKAAGAEWHATDRAATNFLNQSMTYNERISAAARSAFLATDQSQGQKHPIPRRIPSGIGTGAMRSVQSA